MSDDLTEKLPSSDSEKIALILTTVQNLDKRVDDIDLRLSKLEQRFDKLEKKVEERLYDTRPIWQKVITDIAQLQQGQLQLQEGQNRLEGEVREIKISVRDLVFQMSAMSDTMRVIQGRHKDFDLRIRDLEGQVKKPTNSQT